MPDETQAILVSLAKLETKLETKLDSISDTLKQIPELEKRLREVEKYESDIQNNKDEINRLRAQNIIWNADRYSGRSEIICQKQVHTDNLLEQMRKLKQL
jgi:hypothetical protein